MKDGEESKQVTAILFSLTAALLFGSQYVAIKEGLKGFSPLLFGAVTMAIGGLVATAMVARRGNLTLRIFKGWDVIAGVAVATGMIAFQNAGLSLSPASLGGLIVGSNVIFVAPLSAIFFGEKLGWMKIVAVTLGLIGIVTLTTHWDVAVLTSGTFLGYVLLTGASLCIALSYPVTRLALRRLDPFQWTMAFHLIVPIPLLAASLFVGRVEASAGQVPFVLYVGLFCTAVPTILWSKGLEKISFVTSATVLMAESVFAVLLGIIVLSESLDLMAAIGATLVFVAIFLAATAGIRQNNGKRSKGIQKSF